MKIIEEKRGTFVVQMDDGKFTLVSVNDFTRLKFKDFDGKEVSYKFNHKSFVTEEHDSSIVCSLNSEKVRLKPGDGWPTKSALARAILSHQSTRLMEEFTSIWSYIFLKELLGVGLQTRGVGPVDVNPRQNLLLVPVVNQEVDEDSKEHRRRFEFPQLWIKEWRQNKDGSKVAMLVFSKGDKFFQRREGDTFVSYPMIAALTGRDEAKNLWLHYLPPEFTSKTLDECEQYLVGAGKDDGVSASWNK